MKSENSKAHKTTEPNESIAPTDATTSMETVKPTNWPDLPFSFAWIGGIAFTFLSHYLVIC